MAGPTLTMDLDAIRHNAGAIIAAAARKGIEIVAVTKATHGDPAVGRAMVESGARFLGESRLANIRRLRHGGVGAPVMMLRIPALSEVADVVRLCAVSLNSELRVLEGLAREAKVQGRRHDVVIMLEMGDRREGVPMAEAPRIYEAVLGHASLRLAGIGANFMCATGVFPSIEKLHELSDEANRIEREYGIALDVVSGGNSTSIPLLDSPDFPARINQLRVGAALFLGAPMLNGPSSISLRDNAFSLSGELVEVKLKPSLPGGEVGPDAFGKKVVYEDRGMRLRGIVNLGRVDMQLEGIAPRDPGVEIAAASSDHLILDLTESREVYGVGDEISFDVNYPALLQATLSASIEKRLAKDEPKRFERVYFQMTPVSLTPLDIERFAAELREIGLGFATNGTVAATDLPVIFADEGFPSIKEIAGVTGDEGVLFLDSSPDLALKIGASNLAILGLRRATMAQAEALRNLNISVSSIEDVDRLGLAEALRPLIFQLQNGGSGFILIINASVADELSFSERREGLTHREFFTALELVAESGALRGVVLTGLEMKAVPTARAMLNYLMGLVGRRVMDGLPDSRVGS